MLLTRILVSNFTKHMDIKTMRHANVNKIKSEFVHKRLFLTVWGEVYTPIIGLFYNPVKRYSWNSFYSRNENK